MLLEFLDAPVKYNGSPVVENLQVYISDKKEVRVRFKFHRDGNLQPVDIVIYRWSKPKLTNLSIGMKAEGNEFVNNIPFNLQFGYKFVSKQWVIHGYVNGKAIDSSVPSIADLIPIVISALQ